MYNEIRREDDSLQQIAHQVEGIVFAVPEVNGNISTAQSQLPAACPPIVFLKSQPHPKHTTISIDNYSGARAAVEYLLSLGRHKIGLISGPLEWLEARQRRQAWEDVLRVRDGPCSLASGRLTIGRLRAARWRSPR